MFNREPSVDCSKSEQIILHFCKIFLIFLLCLPIFKNMNVKKNNYSKGLLTELCVNTDQRILMINIKCSAMGGK